MTHKSMLCQYCNKFTLSILALRASPVAKLKALQPVLADQVLSDDPLMKGCLPSRLPTQSRFVLRLLRSGYVHVYIPSPPAGVKPWLSYKVTHLADLVPQDSPGFRIATTCDQDIDQRCQSSEHNTTGRKILHIPQAHLIAGIWIAYSANPWSQALKVKHQGNPEVMQYVDLGGGSPNTFKPTAQALKTRVLECALQDYAGDVTERLEFKFVSLHDQLDALVTNLQRAAAGHPKTQGKELAVVLRDPVGIAAELNGLRMLRKQLLDQEVAKPENAHPLNSDAALTGLQHTMLEANLVGSFDKVSPAMSEGAFKDIMRVKPNPRGWPQQTQWVPMDATPENQARYGRGMGRVIFPDHDSCAATWAREQTALTWARMVKHVDEGARRAWKTQFAARMKAQHEDPLQLMEQDWLSAVQATQVMDYFRQHFDAKDPNKVNAYVSSGEVYARESGLIHQPAPYTPDLQEAYLKALDEPIISEKAVALRALVGNQESVFSLIHTQLTGDPGDTGMRDKTYDFLKGVLGLDAGKEALKPFGWLGHSVTGFATGQLSAFSAAVMACVAMPAKQQLAPNAQARLLKLQALWGVQQLMTVAVNGALRAVNPPMPVLIYMQVDAQRALEVLRARKVAGQFTGGSNRYVKKRSREGAKIKLALLTDTDTIKAVRGDLDALLGDPGGGKLRAGPQAKELKAGMGTLAMTEEEFFKLYARQASLASVALGDLRKLVHSGSGLHAKAIGMSLPGYLALGSVLVQGLGLVNGMHALVNAGDEKQVRDAWYGVYDSTAGTVGGLLEMWSVARTATVLKVAGKEVALKSWSLMSLRFLGNVAGAAGGFVIASSVWAKAGEAKTDGDWYASRVYTLSGYAFAGTGVTGLAFATGAVTDTLMARGIGGTVIRTIAMRLGAQGALMTVGGTTLTVSGIGLVFLGAGIAFQIGAIALMPQPMQRWMSRSYFGKDPSLFGKDGKRDDMFAKGNWEAELEAFQVALKEAGYEPLPDATKPTFAEKFQDVAAGLADVGKKVIKP